MNLLIKRTNANKLISSFICFICLTFALLNSSSVYSIYFGRISDLLLFASGLITVVNVFLNVRTLIFPKRALLPLLLLVTIVFVPSFAHGFTSSVIFFFLKFFVISFNMLIYYLHNRNITKLIYNCCFFFCIWASINYLYFTFNLSIVPPTATFITGWREPYNLYGFILFKNISGRSIFGLFLGRMATPFSEPGVFQFFPNACLLICLFDKSFAKKRLLSLFFILLSLLTFSLTGYVCLGCITAVYLFKKKNLFLIIPIAIIGFLLLRYEIILKVDSGSYTDRTADFFNSLNQIADYLPFGIGIGNRDPNAPLLIDSATGKYYSSTNFSGFLSFFFYLGVGGILFVFLCLKGCFVASKNDRYLAASFILVFIVTMLTEPLAFSCITILFLSCGIFEFGWLSKLTSEQLCARNKNILNVEVKE